MSSSRSKQQETRRVTPGARQETGCAGAGRPVRRGGSPSDPSSLPACDRAAPAAADSLAVGDSLADAIGLGSCGRRNSAGGWCWGGPAGGSGGGGGGGDGVYCPPPPKESMLALALLLRRRAEAKPVGKAGSGEEAADPKAAAPPAKAKGRALTLRPPPSLVELEKAALLLLLVPLPRGLSLPYRLSGSLL